MVLCYLRDRADPKLLDRLRDLLGRVDVRSLSMGQESLAEAIRPRQWYNPFPKTRYTERPDTAAATVMEGGVVVLVDNSPSAILLPTSLFGFTQEANDFYFPPLVGTYLRILRMGVFLLSLFVTPVWYLLASVPERIPDWLTFIAVPDPCKLSLFAQLILVEFFPQQLISLFGAANESAFYTEFAVKAFRIYLCMMVPACVNKACFIFLQAVGKALASTLLSMFREVVFGVGFALLLPVFFGLDGVLYSMPVSDVLTFVISAFIIAKTYKELNTEGVDRV